MLFNYSQWFARIKERNYANIPDTLKALISKPDYDKIIAYLLSNPVIKKINQDSSYRFDKKKTGLPRTIVILHEKGITGCILETKSKLANNQKQVLPVVAGSFKKGKPAWEISGALDGVETECFNLVARIKSKKEHIEITKEADFSRMFDAKYIHKNKQGVLFRSAKREEKISLYSLKADYNLLKYLYLERTLSKAKKDQMVSQILKGVKMIHDKDFVHQDLKLQNILVFCEDDYVALADFGMHAEHEKDELAFGTVPYNSPEILYYYEKELCYKRAFAQRYVSDYRKKKINKVEFKRANKANDMWAVGLIIYHIYYGCPYLESRIKKNPLLKGLLAPWRKDRLSINEAIALHEKIIKQEQCEEASPPAKRRRLQ